MRVCGVSAGQVFRAYRRRQGPLVDTPCLGRGSTSTYSLPCRRHPRGLRCVLLLRAEARARRLQELGNFEDADAAAPRAERRAPSTAWRAPVPPAKARLRLRRRCHRPSSEHRQPTTVSPSRPQELRLAPSLARLPSCRCCPREGRDRLAAAAAAVVLGGAEGRPVPWLACQAARALVVSPITSAAYPTRACVIAPPPSSPPCTPDTQRVLRPLPRAADMAHSSSSVPGCSGGAARAGSRPSFTTCFQMPSVCRNRQGRALGKLGALRSKYVTRNHLVALALV